MKIATAILCLLVVAAGPATQPSTQPNYNGPKIAKELRDKIASLEERIAELEKQLLLEQEENHALKQQLASRDGSAGDAIASSEIVRGMSLEQCRRATKEDGARNAQHPDGSETWTFSTVGAIHVEGGVHGFTTTTWRVIFDSKKIATSVYVDRKFTQSR